MEQNEVLRRDTVTSWVQVPPGKAAWLALTECRPLPPSYYKLTMVNKANPESTSPVYTFDATGPRVLGVRAQCLVPLIGTSVASYDLDLSVLHPSHPDRPSRSGCNKKVSVTTNARGNLQWDFLWDSPKNEGNDYVLLTVEVDDAPDHSDF